MRRRLRRQEKFRGLPPGLMWRSPPPNCSCTDPGFLQFAFILPKIFETPKANTDHLPPQHGETRARRALNLGEKRQLLGNSPGKAPACKMRINESESTVNAGLAMLGRSARGLGEALSGLCSSTPPPPASGPPSPAAADLPVPTSCQPDLWTTQRPSSLGGGLCDPGP